MNSQTYERQIRHRLTVLRHADEVSMNVAATCRYYGISVKDHKPSTSSALIK